MHCSGCIDCVFFAFLKNIRRISSRYSGVRGETSECLLFVLPNTGIYVLIYTNIEYCVIHSTRTTPIFVPYKQ